MLKVSSQAKGKLAALTKKYAVAAAAFVQSYNKIIFTSKLAHLFYVSPTDL